VSCRSTNEYILVRMGGVYAEGLKESQGDEIQ
jgi:hypothetical protein